jgi:hypothetical protein
MMSLQLVLQETTGHHSSDISPVHGLTVATVRPRCDGLGVLLSSAGQCCVPVLSLPEIKAVKGKECASTDNQIGVERTNGETK